VVTEKKNMIVPILKLSSFIQ